MEQIRGKTQIKDLSILDLDAFPNLFTGEGGNLLKVNTGETAVEFTDEIDDSLLSDNVPLLDANNEFTNPVKAGGFIHPQTVAFDVPSGCSAIMSAPLSYSGSVGGRLTVV